MAKDDIKKTIIDEISKTENFKRETGRILLEINP